MTRKQLIEQIRKKKSFLCVGLDPDPDKLPLSRSGSIYGVIDFCKDIVKATEEYCVAYKPNVAFFEALGREGWDALHEVAAFLPKDCLRIADAKRADIGNTSTMYARAFFENMDFDAITVAPYMGHDSVEPFLRYDGKWTILLALTSNPGAADLEMVKDDKGRYFFERVIDASREWGSPEKLMYVVGATHPDMLANVRTAAPEHFFLVPGIGAQGGDLQAVCQTAMNADIGLLVNATRSIIYASTGIGYASAAAAEAKRLQQEMSEFLVG